MTGDEGGGSVPPAAGLGRRILRVVRGEGMAGLARRIRWRAASLRRRLRLGEPSLGRQYRRWRASAEPDRPALRRLSLEARSWSPAVPIVVLVASEPGQGDAVRATLGSLTAQAYPAWRAVVLAVSGAGSEEHLDPRVTVAPRGGDADGLAALLAAARPERGDFLTVVDAGLRFTAHGLLEVARSVKTAPDCDLLYTDWDERDQHGRRCRPHFAYGWSPELLLGCDYMGGLVLQRSDVLERSGGWREEDGWAERYDQLLRAGEVAQAPRHLAVIGVSRPVGSPRGAPAEARRRCVESWLDERHVIAQAETGREPEVVDVRFDLRQTPLVDIVVPTRDRIDLLRRCLAAIDGSTYPHRRILIVDNDSRDPDTLGDLARQPHRVLRHPGEFNYSAIVNHAAGATDAPYLLLLNNDTVVRSPGWLEEMLGWCQRDGIGAVGARLVFADGTVQHDGVGIGIGRVAANLDLGWAAARACSAVTAACMLIRREAFEAVGGFDETLPIVFNDVDFCLRLWQAGWRVVFTPRAVLQHDEGSSRGHLAPEADYRRFCRRWGDETALRDAFLGPHVAWPRPLRLRIPPKPRMRARM